jgi:UDP-glucose 4-epimerase
LCVPSVRLEEELVRWLVTGGAGYVGAHVVAALTVSGHEVVVLDDLSTGLSERVPAHARFVEGTLLDAEVVATALEGVDGVVHVAAKKQVGESVLDPMLYYRENVDGLRVLLEQCASASVRRFVFSSSAAVYGEVPTELVVEDGPTNPSSPYGETKLVGEWMARASARAQGTSVVNLRYFNVAGAGRPELGDTGIFNLIPLVFQALSQGRKPRVFGNDYPTPDGTCVRDYVHVSDIARAHVLAADAIGEPGDVRTYNIGRGSGASVLEVLQVVGEVTGLDASYDLVERRPGDPSRLVAAVDRIRDELGFTAEHDLRAMVSSAWEAWQKRAGDPTA